MNAHLRWAIGVVGVGVAGVYLLAPRERPRPRGDLNELQVASDNSHKADRDVRQIRAIVARADAYHAARALPPARAGEVNIRALAPMTTSGIARIERVLRREIQAVAPQGVRHPVTVLVTVDSSALGGAYLRRVVLPETPSQPCVVVYGASPQNVRFPDVPPSDRLLGTCAFYAAYGFPGREMTSWLRDTRAAHAKQLQRPAALAQWKGPFDFGGLSWLDYGSVDLTACSAGRRSSCLTLIGDRRLEWEESSEYWRPTREIFDAERNAMPWVASFYSGESGSGMGWIDGGILSEMAAAVGPATFDKIWRDDRPLAESFEAAEGRPLGIWLEEYVSRYVMPYRAGPGIPPVSAALALALIALSAGLGIGYARREMS